MTLDIGQGSAVNVSPQIGFQSATLHIKRADELKIRPFDAHIRGKLKFQGRGRDKLQWKPSGPLLSKPIHAAMPTGLCPFLTIALNIFSGSLVS